MTDSDWQAWAAEVMGWDTQRRVLGQVFVYYKRDEPKHPHARLPDIFNDANALREFEHVCRERFGFRFEVDDGRESVTCYVCYDGQSSIQLVECCAQELHDNTRESINHAKALATVRAAYAAIEKGGVKK